MSTRGLWPRVLLLDSFRFWLKQLKRKQFFRFFFRRRFDRALSFFRIKAKPFSDVPAIRQLAPPRSESLFTCDKK